jgi:hypothetical protein
MASVAIKTPGIVDNGTIQAIARIGRPYRWAVGKRPATGTATFLSKIFPTERPTTVIGPSPLYHAVICPIFTFTIHLHLLYIVIWFTTILVPHAKAIIRLSHTAASQSSAAGIFGKRLLSEAAT